MNAEKVISRILSEARAEAEKQKDAAKSRLKTKEASFQKQLEAYHDETAKLAQAAADDEKMLLLASTRMDLKKKTLAAKRQLLDGVFKAAAERISKLDKADYRALMTTLILEAVQTGDEEVIIGKDETRIDQSLIDEINSKLKEPFKGQLKLAEQRDDLAGGFILRRGKIKTDVSVDTLMEQTRQHLQIDLAKDLFD